MKKSNIREAWEAAKKSAVRELGLFVFMMIFGVCAVIVALPIIWIVSYLPDWTWWVWSAIFIIWLLFAETITVAIRTYRGEQP